MKVAPSLARLLTAAIITSAATAAWAAETPLAAPPAKTKNWSPPEQKIYAQTLVEQIMAKHPELISVTFHGVPPGLDKVYTMFAGSFLDRIGNADDPDDVEVITKAITIVDPRWNRPKDPVKKFVMMMPLRDASGGHIGLIVLAYKNPPNNGKTETDFFIAATALRDGLQKQIPTYADLFKSARQ